MNVSVYTTNALFVELKHEWADLLARSSSDSIFSTWEWQSVWWQAYQPGELWVLAIRESDGRLLGLAPWFRLETPDGRMAIRAIGCREVTDYIDIIVDAESADAVTVCLADFLTQQADLFNTIELCNLPADSVAYRLLPALLENRSFSVELSHEDVCPIISLPESWDDYLNLLDKKQRHEVRRKLRRAQGTGEAVDWYIVGPEHDLDSELATFLDLMAASDPQKADFLANNQNRQFFETVVPVLYQKGWLQLAFLTVNSSPAAAYLNFDYGGRILVYNSGLLAQEYGHLSLGIVLLAHLIQYAIETHHTVFDFLQGNEVYKYRMGGQDSHVFNLVAMRAG